MHCVLQAVSQAALQDAKQLILSAFDENKDGRIDIAEVGMSGRPTAALGPVSWRPTTVK